MAEVLWTFIFLGRFMKQLYVILYIYHSHIPTQFQSTYRYTYIYSFLWLFALNLFVFFQLK